VSAPLPIDDRSSDDWRELLNDRLSVQAKEVSVFEAYYAGNHPLQFATSKFREAFGSLFAAFADNWCAICVDAPVERLQIVGFRLGEDDDADAWDLWQRNSLDAESVIAHTEAGKCGRAYLLVDPTGDEPRITVEHASQMIVAHDPADRRNRLAALKRWMDDTGYAYATLYLPETVYRYVSTGVVREGARIEWKARSEGGEVPNSLGVVPVIPLYNTPGLLNHGESDLKPAIPLQNAINKLCSDMLVASEYGAFRQRVLTGVEIPRDPETGQPLGRTEIIAAMSRLWTFESKDAQVTDLAATDLGNFVSAIEMFKADFAAQTRTPPHYLLGQVINAAGEALQVAEAGLTSKCRRKILYFTDPWEEAMALALRAKGRDVDPRDLEALWKSPERVSIGELADATLKKKALGIPLAVLWLELGYTPEQIELMENAAPPPTDAPPPPPAASNFTPG
jgi:hypothetical protein